MKVKNVLVFLLPIILISAITLAFYKGYDNYYQKKILNREITNIDNSFKINSSFFDMTIDNIYFNMDAVNHDSNDYDLNDMDSLELMFDEYLDYGYSKVVITDLNGYGYDSNKKEIDLSTSTTYLLTSVRNKLVTNKIDVYHTSEQMVICEKFTNYIVYLVVPIPTSDFYFIDEDIYKKGYFTITSNSDEILYTNNPNSNWLLRKNSADQSKYQYFTTDVSDTGVKFDFIVSNEIIIANSEINTVNVDNMFLIFYTLTIFVYVLFVLASNKQKKAHANEHYIENVFESSKIGISVYKKNKEKFSLLYQNDEFVNILDLRLRSHDCIQDEMEYIFHNAKTNDEEFDDLYYEAIETGEPVYCVTKIVGPKSKFIDCLVQLQITNETHFYQIVKVESLISDNDENIINNNRIQAILKLSNVSTFEFNLSKNTVSHNIVFKNSRDFATKTFNLDNGKSKFENFVVSVIGKERYNSYLNSVEHAKKSKFKCIREFSYNLFEQDNKLIIVNEQYNGEEIALVYVIHGDKIIVDEIRNKEFAKLPYLKSRQEFNRIARKNNPNATLLILITKNNLKVSELISDLECIYNCFKEQIDGGTCYMFYNQKIIVYFTEPVKIISLKKDIYDINSKRPSISDSGISYSENRGYYEMYRECINNITAVELL